MLDDRTLLDHVRMLDDPRRLEPFARALAATCEGRVVAEIGVGLGPLSLFALRAGARRVYGIESDPRTLEFTTALLRAHGYGPDRFVPLAGRSDAVEPDEPVDVIVGELIDSIGIGENAAVYLDDARRRWLAPGGHVIPGGIEVEVGLAGCRRFAAERDFFARTLGERHGLDYRPVLDRLAAPRRTLTVEPDELCSPLVAWQQLDFGAGTPVRTSTELELPIERDGRLDGLVFGFRLVLCGDVAIDTRPGSPPTCWEQGFLPLPRALEVTTGEAFRVRLDCPPTTEPWAPVRATLDRAASAASVDAPN